MKKIAALVLAAAMAVSIFPLPSCADEGTENFKREQEYPEGIFEDVRAGDWFHDNVAAAYELGLMRGYEGYFAPEGSVTVAETVTMAARLHSIYHTGAASFEQGSPWYQVYVDYARANGILGDEVLSWNSPATRRQVAMFLARALPESELTPINTLADGDVPDVKSWHEGAAEIYRLYRAGVLTGSDAFGHFQPDQNIWRSAVAAIVSRMADGSLRQTLSLRKPDYPRLYEQPRVEDGFFAASAMLGNSLAQGMRAFSGVKELSFFDYQSTTVFNPNGADPDRCYDRLLEGKYDRVYMEYGINEIYGDTANFISAYGALIDDIRAHMPGTEIYVMSVTPVTKKVSDRGGFTMARIREINAALQTMCAEKGCWYLDCCEALCDETGFLPESLAGWDGSPHLAAEGYRQWAELLRTHYAP